MVVLVRVLPGFFFILASSFVDAQTEQVPQPIALELTLSVVEGAPTPEDVVAGFSPGSPIQPLEGLSAGDATAVQLFLDRRATGDFRALLDANPTAPRARLERSLVIEYGTAAGRLLGLAALEVNPFVEYVGLTIGRPEFSGGEAAAQGVVIAKGTTQPNLDQLAVRSAQQLAKGFGRLGIIDSGVQVDHPDLAPFNGGTYLGGNFLEVQSSDQVSPGTSVDEREPVPETNDSCDNEDGVSDGFADPDFGGHGTHVAGVATANDDGAGVLGVCPGCGFFAFKITWHPCNGATGLNDVTPLSARVTDNSMVELADLGVEAVNLSLGFKEGDQGGTRSDLYCDDNPNALGCLALSRATPRDILYVAAAGNDREVLDWPASDSRVISVGGIDDSGDFWDESPGSTSNCPTMGSDEECGSNFSYSASSGRQDVLATATTVFSTFYEGLVWNASIGCSDASQGASDDGYGFCTGTSMSTPHITGLVGLLRSINPLVRAGSVSVLDGIRGVLNHTTVEAQQGTPFALDEGYGTPDAREAAEILLGRVNGSLVTNRLTPLFGLESTGFRDHAYTTSPRQAVWFAINQSSNYTTSIGQPVPSYTSFPTEPGLPGPPEPRAVAYVWTTPARPPGASHDLIELYQAACDPAGAGCDDSTNFDFLVAAGEADLEAVYAQNYTQFYGRLGYIYPDCSGEGGCTIPQGTERLYRQCDPSPNDCAIFLESDRAAMEAQGYTAAFPSGSNPILGYAYPGTDVDGDGLVDGFERTIGLGIVGLDSDSDGCSDAAEYPMTGIPGSDPLAAGSSTCIFDDGFE